MGSLLNRNGLAATESRGLIAMGNNKKGDGIAPLKPERFDPRITSAPKVRQIYWCDFWSDARLPEMWKTRPVIIISHRNTLYGICSVIPTSTDPENENDKWAYKLPEIDGCRLSWAICNHPTTLATSRLSQISGKIPVLEQAHFDNVLDLVLKWLPSRRP